VVKADSALYLLKGTAGGIFFRATGVQPPLTPGDLIAIAVEGRAPWPVPGAQVYNNIVSFAAADPVLAKGLLADIRAGSRVGLVDSAGNPLASWSLSGSSSALKSWDACAALLR
jgi:hypothetical protein